VGPAHARGHKFRNWLGGYPAVGYTAQQFGYGSRSPSRRFQAMIAEPGAT